MLKVESSFKVDIPLAVGYSEVRSRDINLAKEHLSKDSVLSHAPSSYHISQFTSDTNPRGEPRAPKLFYSTRKVKLNEKPGLFFTRTMYDPREIFLLHSHHSSINYSSCMSEVIYMC